MIGNDAHMRKTFASAQHLIKRGEVWVHKTTLTLQLFIEVPAESDESGRWCMCVLGVSHESGRWCMCVLGVSHESGRSCMCVLGVSISPHSMIISFDFRTVPDSVVLFTLHFKITWSITSITRKNRLKIPKG